VTLLTADTLRLVGGYVEVTPLGPVPLKGLADPIEVYELAGLGLLRSRLGAAAARRLTRFVGRAAELEQLREALGHAWPGHGQIVAIVGEPGVGKCRLVWEVTHSHRTHGWRILHACSVSYGKATRTCPSSTCSRDTSRSRTETITAGSARRSSTCFLNTGGGESLPLSRDRPLGDLRGPLPGDHPPPVTP
jgi:AAA ATPase-like protein